jgi:hypothetical protein
MQAQAQLRAPPRVFGCLWFPQPGRVADNLFDFMDKQEKARWISTDGLLE